MLLAGALGGATDPLRPLAPFQAGARQASAQGGDHSFERIDKSEAVPARLTQAQRDGMPVILDFYADWCISCKVMERNVFSAPEVQDAMADYRLLQVDVTENTASDQALLDRYGLFGPPTLLFFDASGEELADARILGKWTEMSSCSTWPGSTSTSTTDETPDSGFAAVPGRCLCSCGRAPARVNGGVDQVPVPGTKQRHARFGRNALGLALILPIMLAGKALTAFEQSTCVSIWFVVWSASRPCTAISSA